MSLSLLDNQTRVSPGSFFPQLGGGGGGGGSNIVVNSVDSITATISTISALSINGLGGVNDPVNALGGINVGGIGLNMSNNPMLFTAGGNGILFAGNDGNIQGLSTINGAPYPPTAGGYPVTSTIIGPSPVHFAAVSSGSAFVLPPSIDMNISHQYIVSADMVYTPGDTTTGLILNAPLLSGGVVAQSNQSGANFMYQTCPLATSGTFQFQVATTSATVMSGDVFNMTITDLGPRAGSL